MKSRALILIAICLSVFMINRAALLAQDTSPDSGPITLVTLGDSLTEGEGDQLEQGGYPGRLLKLIEAVRPGSTLNNVGHSGWNSDALINGDQGLPSELDQALEVISDALDRGESAVALVWIGSNDLFYLYEYGDPDAAAEAEDLAHYEANLITIVSQLKDAGAQVFIALLDDQSQRPVTQNGLAFTGISKAEVVQMGEQVKRYNEVITKVAAQYGVITVDFYNTTLFTDEATLSDDGNHPNPDGYDIIAQRWFEAIQQTPVEAQSAATPEAAPQMLNEDYLTDTSLLDDTPCAAPCWLGIVPGETPWRDMRTIVEDDGRFDTFDEIKDDSSEVRLFSFNAKGSPTSCCRVYSSMDGKTVGQILILLAPDQIALEEIITKYGDPTYAAGADVTDDQALVSLFYPSVPLAVYVFTPGIKEGTLTEESQVIGALYITPADMEMIVSTPELHPWRGYGPLAGWLDDPSDAIIPDIQSEATAEAE